MVSQRHISQLLNVRLARMHLVQGNGRGRAPDLPRLSPLQGVGSVMRIILIVVSLAMPSAGCRQDPLAELRQGAQGILDDARTRANDVRELSATEIQALWAIEYTSLEVVLVHADLGDMDERLNAMGRERWECYHVSEHEQGRVFYFKRRTSNAVAYLTNLLRVGAVAF